MARWLLPIVVACLAAGGGYFVATRWAWRTSGPSPAVGPAPSADEQWLAALLEEPPGVAGAARDAAGPARRATPEFRFLDAVLQRDEAALRTLSGDSQLAAPWRARAAFEAIRLVEQRTGERDAAGRAAFAAKWPLAWPVAAWRRQATPQALAPSGTR